MTAAIAGKGDRKTRACATAHDTTGAVSLAVVENAADGGGRGVLQDERCALRGNERCGSLPGTYDSLGPATNG